MTNQRLDELLEQCTVRLNVAGGQGTGFFVAPGLILTCAHVVADVGSNSINVFWKKTRKNYSASLKDVDTNSNIDLALLELKEEYIYHPCVYFDKSIPQLEDKFFTFGYPFDSFEQYAEGDSVTLEHEGNSYKENGALFFKLKGGQIKSGISGSPLLNIRTKGVCGIVIISRNTTNNLGGRAVPTAVILEKFSELVELNQQFHQKNKLWTNLLTSNSPSLKEREFDQKINDLSFRFNQAYRGADWNKVIELGESILKLNVRHQPTLAQTAQAYRSRSLISFEKADYDTAITDCSRAIELAPKAEYYWQRSKSYHQKNQFDAAIADCNQAIKLKQEAQYYGQRGRAYNNKGNYEQALADTKTAIQLKPRQAEHYELYGIICINMGKISQAIEKLTQAIKFDSKQPIFYFRRGLCYANLTQHSQAINDLNIAISFNGAVKLDSNLIPDCYYWLGVSYAANKNYLMAVQRFNTAIALDPKNPYYYANRGWSFYHQGLFILAIDDANQAINLDGSILNFRNLLVMSQRAINSHK